ncbi:hypothetical protein M378DRAFT_19520, partial [Amanita muscaria Koide BX008]
PKEKWGSIAETKKDKQEIRALHPHTGVHQDYQLHEGALDHKGQTITTLGGEAFILPPYSRSRRTKQRGPLLELLSHTHSVYKPSPYDSVPPGLRARDLFRDRIKRLHIPPKGDDIDAWIIEVSRVLDPVIQSPGFLVLASPPPDVRKGTGAYSVQVLPVTEEPPHSTHPHTSNHHELTMIGLVDACERITLTRGHQFLLARNLAALLTITSPSLGRNRHYARTFDRLLKGWFMEDPSNTITLGWYPKEYNPEALEHLPNWTRAARVSTGSPPASPSAATHLRIAKATMNKYIRIRNVLQLPRVRPLFSFVYLYFPLLLHPGLLLSLLGLTALRHSLFLLSPFL